MDLILILLVGISIIFIIKNISLMKEMSVSKEYKTIYRALIAREDNIIERLTSYIEKEKDEYPKNKAKVLLAHKKLLNNEDVSDLIKEIDFEKIFLINNKYNTNHVNYNSDMFIWIMSMLPRLNKLNLIDLLLEKIEILDDKLSNHLEYKTFNAACAFIKHDKENSKFLNELINGEYSGLYYDKQMIGVVKRIALSLIASDSKEKNVEYADELAIFAKSYIGGNMLSDLDIYEVYKPNETN